FLRHGRARRHQADVGAGKIMVFERFDLQRPLAIGDVHALAAARGERHDFVGRKRPLGEDTEHLPADIAGPANDGDGVTPSYLSRELAVFVRVPGAGRTEAEASTGEHRQTQCHGGKAPWSGASSMAMSRCRRRKPGIGPKGYAALLPDGKSGYIVTGP